MDKNTAKLDLLMGMMEKWVSMLRKILQYTTSARSGSAHLGEEVRLWRVLSRKFDELEYEFNVFLWCCRTRRPTNCSN